MPMSNKAKLFALCYTEKSARNPSFSFWRSQNNTNVFLPYSFDRHIETFTVLVIQLFNYLQCNIGVLPSVDRF